MTSTEIPVSPPPAPPRKSGRGRRVVLWLLVIAILVVFASIAGVLWAEGQIERIPSEELTSLDAPPASGGVRNILVVGTDSRENLPDDFDRVFGDFSGSRTDTIMIVHFTPGGGAQLLSIPRDLKVEIDGYKDNRVNAAYAFGGADLLIDTIQTNLGIPIHHYMEIGFGGFAELVDALGGVTMDFPYDARDTKSGFSVKAGTRVLDGEEALAYSRSRHYRELRDGEWKSVGGSDLGRTRRQQAMLMALFTEAASASTLDVANFARKFAGLIKADEGLSTPVIVDLGRKGLALNRADIEMTKQIVAAAKPLGVAVHDHIIVGRDGHASFKTLKLI